MSGLLEPTNLGDDYFRDQKLTDYTWIFAAAIIFAWLTAYGIGANDVANAFATSVGSKAITMRQCIMIAAVCEFCGAFFLGAQVTSTIKSGIVKPDSFSREPELLMFGMLCVDISVSFWLWLATYLELPVSTTHSAVGGVIGMGLVLGGADAVNWEEDSDTFPWIGGVVGIVITWVTSPLFSAIAALVIFFLVRTFVLRRKNSFHASLYALPIIIAITIAINLMFLIKKGAKNQGGEDVEEWVVQVAAWSSGVFCGLVAACFMPLVRRRVLNAEEADKAQETVSPDKPATEITEQDSDKAEESPPQSKFRRFLNHTVDHDVHADIQGDRFQKVHDIHERAEVFDPRTEESFKYLQVFSAACNSLAHGANDVANAIGPLAAVTQIWKTGTFDSKVRVPRWILAVGGTGLVVGLATYGYHIIRAIGLKICRITATRGFAIELGSALIVMIASSEGLPVSTTHCMVGAVIGVGALEGRRGVHWMLFLKIFIGWVFTLVIAGCTCALFTAIGVYSPSKQMASTISDYEDGLRLRSEVYNYAFQWTAEAAGKDPASVSPPVLNDTGYYYAVVPDNDHLTIGVPNDKAYLQWKDEVWKDYPMWAKATTWRQLWIEGLGDEAPDWDGANSSTVTSEQMFRSFDRLASFAFSANQQEEVNAILAGDKVLCCQEQYKCCERKCDYEKVNEDCENKCEMRKKDANCEEKACDEDDMKKKDRAAGRCKVLNPSDDCPFPIEEGSKNYVGPEYVSNPVMTAPATPVDSSYGDEYTDWREDDYDPKLKLCPVKL